MNLGTSSGEYLAKSGSTQDVGSLIEIRVSGDAIIEVFANHRSDGNTRNAYRLIRAETPFSMGRKLCGAGQFAANPERLSESAASEIRDGLRRVSDYCSAGSLVRDQMNVAPGLF